jgi:long-chain fatty acid transport protein
MKRTPMPFLLPIPAFALRFPCLLLAVPLTAWCAEGTRLIGNGPAQDGTAGAGVATPYNASWISLNPAGLIAMDNNVAVSSDIISANATLTPNGFFAHTGAGELNDDVIVFAPSAAITIKKPQRTYGFGMYTVSGLAMELPAARSIAGALGGNFDRRAEQRFMSTNFSVAQPITDQLALGFSALMNYVDARSDTVTTLGTQTSAQYERDTALGAGFSLSLYYASDDFRIGASYQSRQWMETLDKYRDAFVGTPDQPQVFQSGIAWRVNTWLEPMLDYRFIDWSSVQFYGEGLQWRDQHIIKLAALGYMNDHLTLRAGLSYGRSPITESHVFLNGLTLLITEWHGTLGLGWRINQAWDVQCTYLHGFENTLTDNGANGLGAGTQASLTVHSIIAGLGWRY